MAAEAATSRPIESNKNFFPRIGQREKVLFKSAKLN
jgi:hypothetical protein